MTISLTQKIVAIGILLVAAVGIGLYLSTENTNKPLSGLEMRYVADFSDERNVIGFSGNVFAGKVTKILKHTKSDNLPVTLYEVEVFHNIKGKLKETVIIKDTVGYSVDSDGEQRVSSLNGIDTFMQAGETYLFAVNYDEEMTKQEGLDVFSLGGHPNFNKKMSFDETLGINELEVVAKQDEVVKKWEIAYENENEEMQKFIDIKTINNQ